MVSLSNIAYARLCHLPFLHNSLLCVIHITCATCFKNASEHFAKQNVLKKKIAYSTSDTRIVMIESSGCPRYASVILVSNYIIIFFIGCKTRTSRIAREMCNIGIMQKKKEILWRHMICLLYNASTRRMLKRYSCC